MFYIITILLCMAVIATVNYFVSAPIFGFDIWYIIIAVTLATVIVIAIDAIFATIVRWCLPKKYFTLENKIFCAKPKEAKFYEKIGVRKWKELVLELGAFTNFRKNKIAEPNNNEYLSRYIMEANYGVVVHLADMIFGFLLLVVYPPYWLCFGLPVAFVNLVLNFLPFATLRYNLPKLQKLYALNVKRQERELAKSA